MPSLRALFCHQKRIGITPVRFAFVGHRVAHRANGVRTNCLRLDG